MSAQLDILDTLEVLTQAQAPEKKARNAAGESA
jgi:hypothetical protein